jgi:hypothetical protein
MRSLAALVCYALLGCGSASADCLGAPQDELNFWLGSWHDPASPAAEHYAVRRTAGGCAVEEVLTGGNGQVQGVGLAGWDTERKQWRQLWVDANAVVTAYWGGPAADGTFVLTSEPKDGGIQWLYTYRNIHPDGMDADYASRRGEEGPWTTVWQGHFDRIAPP